MMITCSLKTSMALKSGSSGIESPGGSGGGVSPPNEPMRAVTGGTVCLLWGRPQPGRAARRLHCYNDHVTLR